MSPAGAPRRPQRVFLHLGLPKTGTTYLQDVLWSNRRRLAGDGIHLPGFGHREHLWAALDLAERPRLERRHVDAPGAWSRLVEEALGQSRDVLLTHEFFCIASKAQAARAVAAFGDREVHLVLTVRDAAGLVLAGWQESVKNGSTRGLQEVLEGKSASGPEFSMRAWDVAGVLRRWGHQVPPERVHILPMPGPGQAREDHWRHFAEVLGVDAEAYDAPAQASNPALGIVQIELLRRINAHLPAYSARDRGVWIRGYLAEGRLAHQDRSRGSIPDEYASRFHAQDEAALAAIEAGGYDVVGDLATLQKAEVALRGRLPETVSSDELVESAAQLVAVILADVRASTGDVPPRPGGN